MNEMTDDLLLTHLTLAAQEKELDLYKKLDVFTKVPRTQSVECIGRQPIGIRWVGVNKRVF